MEPRLLPDYQEPPGVCVLCRSARRHPGERIVATGTTFDCAAGYAHDPLVFCEPCLCELARLLGMASADRVHDVTVLLAEAEEARDRLAIRLGETSRALDALRHLDATATPTDLSHDQAHEPLPVGGVACPDCDWPNQQALVVHQGRAHPKHPRTTKEAARAR